MGAAIVHMRPKGSASDGNCFLGLSGCLEAELQEEHPQLADKMSLLTKWTYQCIPLKLWSQNWWVGIPICWTILRFVFPWLPCSHIRGVVDDVYKPKRRSLLENEMVYSDK